MRAWQRYAAEFLGTLIFVGVGTGTIIALGATNLEADITTVALAFGFAWVAALYTFGGVSGGHFNPALTLAMFLERRVSPTDLLGYWIAQFLGAVAASATFAWVLGRSAVATGYTYVAEPTIGGVAAMVAEAVFTMVLAAAFLVLSRSRAHTRYLAMGITLSALTFIGLRFTGASMNPARSFAPSIIGADLAQSLGSAHQLWVFFVGPLLGAVVGWVVYKLVVAGDVNLADDFEEIRNSVS
jgi:aquaporin Z